MREDKLKDLKVWLSNNSRPSSLVFADDDPEEEIVGNENVGTDVAEEIQVNLTPSKLSNFGNFSGIIFSDGVMRHRVIGSIDVNGIGVPVSVAHIIAGAMRLELGSKELKPIKRKELVALMFPYDAITKSIGQTPFALPPSVIELDGYNTNNFKKLTGEDVIFSDLSTTLGVSASGNPRELISVNDLPAAGKIRNVAKNRAKELMRVLELSLLLDLRNDPKYDEDLIVVDGPIGLLLKYVGIIDPSLRNVFYGLTASRLQEAKGAYKYMHNVVGVVKKVVKIPASLSVQSILSGSPKTYRWNTLVSDDAEGKEDSFITNYILSTFMILRPEILRENFPTFSNLSGMIRVDTPLPSIVSETEWVSFITNPDFRDTDTNNQIATRLNDKGKIELERLIKSHSSSLNEIINVIYSLRYPITANSPYRTLVELAPIREVEIWLSSYLLSKYDLATLVYT